MAQSRIELDRIHRFAPFRQAPALAKGMAAAPVSLYPMTYNVTTLYPPEYIDE